MPDSKPDRVPKRKSRDAEEAPRKKQHRGPPADDVQFEDYGSGDNVPAKSSRKYKDKFAPRPERQYPSVNELKKRIRDVKRLLQKPNLPADGRILQERALAGYEQDLLEETARRDRSQMIKKYHFVRFLDRKNATKQLNRLERRQKEQSLDSKQKKQLESRIHATRVNLNYTIYYPLTEKYIALYPKSKASDKDGAESGSESESEQKTQGDETKPPLWSVVEKCMEEGTLGKLRDGKLNIGADGKQAAAPTTKASVGTDSKKSKKKGLKEPEALKKSQPTRTETDKSKYENFNRRDRRREQAKAAPAPVQADGDDSDGGFFE